MSGQFPRGFLWGAASSAYQVEGAACADGKVPSIWDTFAHTDGKIFESGSGDVACDGYHRFREDVLLMQQLGIRAYRFSINWPRVITDLSGTVNETGLRYYEQLVDCCLEAGITPYITLFHWELPQYLEDQGGWLRRETAEAFCRFAAVIAARLKGKVRHYFTLNEPQCFVGLGLSSGVHAPGKRLPAALCYQAAHHLLLAHGLAVQALRQIDPDAEIGIASTGSVCYPAAPGDDNDAAREMFRCETGNFFSHALFLDPIVLGQYPACALPLLPAGYEADLPIISQPIDCLGANIYNGHEISCGSDTVRCDGFPRTALKWPVTPDCLGYGTRYLYDRYRLPIYITENGLSCNDRIYSDGKVHDLDRIEFLYEYLTSLQGAIESGADIRGYFHWALTDNFEWNNGYGERFGLIYIDYRNQARIPKDSARWYQRLIAHHCIPAPSYPDY
ncbi:MAG: GH1 family beta-glucosidase [Oscillospiraceae bacterium]|nr:GH1 family beta-glucosidase [Oscillospiraceae bacterium]